MIEAGTAGFVAECYQLYEPPPLGSLVRVTDSAGNVFGIVHDATTSSLEPGRRPIARGRDEASEEDIYRASPQLEKLLRSEFSALVVGHSEGDELRHYLPPRPVRIHGFVYLCDDRQVREFSRRLDFLGLLLDSQLPVPAEEVIAATLRLMGDANEDRRGFLVAAGKELANLLGGEFGRLRAVLSRIGTV
ncbi:MAG: hypothetical protein V3S10_03595 [Dehalococcoidales bacterium]